MFCAFSSVGDLVGNIFWYEFFDALFDFFRQPYNPVPSAVSGSEFR